MRVQQMIATHPQVPGRPLDVLVACIEACLDAAQASTACADACLAEPAVAELTHCIRFDLDCADLCKATALVASRRAGENDTVVRRLIKACAEACRVCADECALHAETMEHCRLCAAACRDCQAACLEAAAMMTTPTLQ